MTSSGIARKPSTIAAFSFTETHSFGTPAPISRMYFMESSDCPCIIAANVSMWWLCAM